MWACGRCGARDAAADRVRTVCGPCRAQRWYARVRLFGINASATNWGESRPPTHTMLRKLKGQKAGQLNRHARYRPATTTRNHCHAAVVSLGGCFCAKGSVESTHKVHVDRPATTCTTQNTASHRTLEKMSAACTPFSLTFDRRHCHDQHVRIYRGGGLLRCARAASALSVRWPSERRPKTALSGPLRLRRARTSSRARAAPFRISSPSSASAAWIVCRDGRKLMVLGSINGQLLPP